MITTVVFDMDGVLCHYDVERRIGLLSSWSGREPDAIRAAIWESGFEDEAERGNLSAEEYLTGFGERIGYALTSEEWAIARRTAIEPNLEMLALAGRVADDHKIAMFTNNPFLLKREFRNVFPLAADVFGPNAVFSAELGRCKPDLEAFHRLATRLVAAPDEILFFDDSPSYVDGAREAGLFAERVTDIETAIQSLERHGVTSALRS